MKSNIWPFSCHVQFTLPILLSLPPLRFHSTAIHHVRLDARDLADRHRPVAADRAEHLRGFDLVPLARFHHHLQRHHGLRLRILLRQNSAHQTLTQEDLGGIHRRIRLHARLRDLVLSGSSAQQATMVQISLTLGHKIIHFSMSE